MVATMPLSAILGASVCKLHLIILASNSTRLLFGQRNAGETDLASDVIVEKNPYSARP